MQTKFTDQGGYEAKRLRVLTEQFTQLQGLKIVPFCLIFFAKAAADDAPYEKPVMLSAMAVAILALFPLSRYYRARFGTVKPKMSCYLRDGAAVAGFVAMVIGSRLAGSYYDLAIQPIPLAIAALFAYVHYYSQGLRRHYGLAAILLALIGVLPALGADWLGDLFGSGAVAGDIFLGFAFLVLGLLDHAVLVRGLKPLPDEESDDDAV